MTTRNKAERKPAKTFLIFKALIAADDFVTANQLIEVLNGQVNANQVGAALHHLKNKKAVDCLASDGKLWWYSTPDTDERSKQVEERVEEDVPRIRNGRPSSSLRPKHSSEVSKSYVPVAHTRMKKETQEANEIADKIRSKKKRSSDPSLSEDDRVTALIIDLL